MEMTIKDRAMLIIQDIVKEEGNDPARIFRRMAQKEYMNMHGPEHHVLDGACILTAYRNAGGKIDLEQALSQILVQGLRMPGAMCGLWGVCGAISSIGAALAIIDSEDGTWGEHMRFTSEAISALGAVNGPRCCKRDAMLAFRHSVEYINSHYDVKLDYKYHPCEFSDRNRQCIHGRCPFYRE